MTNRKTTRPEATDNLPLDTDQIHAILRGGVLDVARRSPDLVDDLIQDAWVALLRQRHRLATVDPPALRAYIRRIASSAAIDRLRALKTAKRGGNTTSVPFRRTVRRAAGRGLSRAILELLYLHGLAPDAAANRLGISPANVYSAVHRARARLARRAIGG